MNIGDRMKNNYENRSRHYLLRRTPVIIRVDGKAFHSFTKSFNKPFDDLLMDGMLNAAIKTVMYSGMQGFKLAYTQSDECSFLLTDYDRIETNAWFDYNKSKLETITASTFTYFFNDHIRKYKTPLELSIFNLAVFDARAFNIPESEISNYFLWRAKDWERNSLSMYCRSFFSDKELLGKNKQQQHDMLYSVGKNWCTDLNDRQKNGTFFGKDVLNIYHKKPQYEDIDSLVKEQMKVDE